MLEINDLKKALKNSKNLYEIFCLLKENGLKISRCPLTYPRLLLSLVYPAKLEFIATNDVGLFIKCECYIKFRVHKGFEILSIKIYT